MKDVQYLNTCFLNILSRTHGFFDILHTERDRRCNCADRLSGDSPNKKGSTYNEIECIMGFGECRKLVIPDVPYMLRALVPGYQMDGYIRASG